MENKISLEELAELRAKAKASIDRARQIVNVVRDNRWKQARDRATWNVSFYNFLYEARIDIEASKSNLKSSKSASNTP